MKSSAPGAVLEEVQGLSADARLQLLKGGVVLLLCLRELPFGVEAHLLGLISPVVRGGNQLIREIFHRHEVYLT